MKYRCPLCGYTYDEDKEGVRFADLPDDWCRKANSNPSPSEILGAVDAYQLCILTTSDVVYQLQGDLASCRCGLA